MFLAKLTGWEGIVCEIDPASGKILRKFKQPADWKWDAPEEISHWEEYSGKTFLVFMHAGKMVFQEGQNRFELDRSYSCSQKQFFCFWKVFKLFRSGEQVFKFTYRDPQTRPKSLFRAMLFDDDWWDWETPFSEVVDYLEKLHSNSGI